MEHNCEEKIFNERNLEWMCPAQRPTWKPEVCIFVNFPRTRLVKFNNYENWIQLQQFLFIKGDAETESGVETAESKMTSFDLFWPWIVIS